MNTFLYNEGFIRHAIRVERKSTTDLFHGTVDFISQSASERRY